MGDSDAAVEDAVSGRSASTSESDASAASEADAGRRTIEAPKSLVKMVVIFSTLLAIASVLIGFTLLDAATRVIENPPGSLFVGLVKAVTGLSRAGVEPYLTPIALTVGLFGLLFIGLGAWVYVMGTRFRTTDGNA